VLSLVGPASTELSGVGFILTADATKVSWATVKGSEYASSALFTAPLVSSKVTGDELQAGVYQKGKTGPVTTGAASVLATVALDLRAGLPIAAGVPVAATPGKAVILNPPGSTTPTTPITIEVGTLVAN
jgi:hypothetical protein